MFNCSILISLFFLCHKKKVLKDPYIVTWLELGFCKFCWLKVKYTADLVHNYNVELYWVSRMRWYAEAKLFDHMDMDTWASYPGADCLFLEYSVFLFFLLKCQNEFLSLFGFKSQCSASKSKYMCIKLGLQSLFWFFSHLCVYSRSKC